MRIAVVIPSFYPAVIYGGTITASLDFARMMAGLNHEVFVSTTNSNRYSRLNVERNTYTKLEHNIFVKYYNETFVDKLSFPLLLNVWKDIKKADLVHIHAIFNTPIPFALFFSYILRKKVLLSPHGVLGKWVMGQGSVMKKLWLSVFIRPFANHVIWHATSEQEEMEIKNHFPLAKVRIIPLPLNCDIPFVKTLDKQVFSRFLNASIDADSKIIISMGRLQKKKGFDILIRSFKNTLAKFPQSYLLIAGGDEGEKANLEILVHQCGLQERVCFTGDLQGAMKISFLQNADLFVLPSHNENFGLVYLESLAAGTPVVASKETPWEEVEQHGCGKWVHNSIEETSKAMIEMLNRKDPELREKARKLAEKYSMDNVRKILAETLDNLTKNV